MTKIRYYGDSHVARAIAAGLTARDVDIVLAVDVGMAHAADQEHLQLAHAQGRVIISRDRDFLRLHAEGHSHSGIVCLTRDWAFGDAIRYLEKLASEMSAEDMAGRIKFM